MKFRPGYLALAPLAPLGAAVAHAALTPRKTSAYQPQPDPDRAMAYAEKLSAMIRCDTTSYANVREPEKFERFHALLAGLFPLVHEKLERTDIDGNLLYYWPGRAHDRPIVLMSHQDVVPAEGTWEHAPFSGDIADGKVWGRGASDTKCSVMAFFQAVEELLAAGYERLWIICGTYLLCGIMDTLASSLRGLGYSVLPMVVSLVGSCLLRLVWIAPCLL